MANIMDQMKILQKMMTDPNFGKFMSHPKVQELARDPEFQETMSTKDPEKIKAHPKLKDLSTDPELRDLMTKINFDDIFS